MLMPLAIVADSGVRKVILAEIDKCFGVIGCNITSLSQNILHTLCDSFACVLGIFISTQSSESSGIDEKASHEIGSICVAVDVVHSKRRRRHALSAVVVADEIHDKILESFDLEVGGDNVEAKIVVKRVEIVWTLKFSVVHPANEQLECKFVELLIDKGTTKLRVCGGVCGGEDLWLLHGSKERALAGKQIGVDFKDFLRTTNLELGHRFVVIATSKT